ncbi:flagellar hook-length control protein FliK [Roseburia rectibacter]|uniref:flagellar hook-length control protein FliK n=1 Tax=Roseburia rectibacter TaxID=2763062 RepID=UPI00164C96C4|nr:flagellar hook-length control protein FliK [Roseburia rectibacter]UMZ01853.1 flagellar hook-length control protein FliK [Roseburia rectibacter]
MGSTSVSEVTGIMSVGQGSQTLTGTKEGDLKVQFAEVMSQMTTQVGYGYSYGGQNGKQNMSVVTGKSSVTDNYERYQNNAASIKNNPSDKTDIQTGNTDEKLAAFEEDVRQVLKEKLGVTDEEITDAMQKLGLTVADLIQPNQLTQLTAELTGSENIGELLCNDSFMEIVNEIGGLSQDLLDDLGMTSQMFTETVAAASQVVTTPKSAGIEQLPEMQVTENVKADKTAANDTSDQMNSVLKEENTVQTASDADEVEIQKQEDNILLQKEVAEETDTKADDGQTGNRNESGNTSNQTAFVSQEHTVDPAAAKTPETVPEFSRQLDTLDLIRQVTEFTKVTVREAQTTMEMQLNPEHLGKLYIEVTTKEGNVSAHIMTQNELVKEALESQMAELKQSMNQAGVKVDAVEVTVGSHEFEKNLEQNAKQDERQAEEQEKASPKTRRINLDELDELSGVMSEEEALVAQIMADHGNSVDYTA